MKIFSELLKQGANPKADCSATADFMETAFSFVSVEISCIECEFNPLSIGDMFGWADLVNMVGLAAYEKMLSLLLKYHNCED